jgi:uncharacterized protein (DUF2141 family)
MVFRTLLILIIVALVSSCAQVGFLTGGEQDYYAPEPVRSQPENGSVSFSSREVKLTFDEFVQLKDPQQNIFIVPNDAKIEAKLHKKELTLSWNETLQANTTYVIYLNSAVVDASEGNGTLFSYVFSTGAVIDTLTRTFRVINSATNTPVQKTTVGLFSDKDSLKPVYFGMTDPLGFADLAYLKEGVYTVRAFQDENKDLQISAAESLGFLEEPVQVSVSDKDTLLVQLFQPLPTKWITRFEYKAPGILEAELSQPLNKPRFALNGVVLDSLNIRKVSDVLYRIIPLDSVKQSNELNMMSGTISDSASLRIAAKERIAPLVLTTTSPNIIPVGKPLEFQMNGRITEVDTSKIRMHFSKDSLVRIPFRTEQKADLLYLRPEVTEGGAFTVQFAEGAINQHSKSLQSSFEVKSKKDLGTLLIQPEGFAGPLIIELLKDKKVVRKNVLAAPTEILFEELIPGEYTIRITEDKNNNGLWDTGDLYKKMQPEKIRSFDSPVRIRPNWDMKLTLKAEK